MKTTGNVLDEPAAEVAEGNRLFPVFLKLESFRLLIVGGGNVALEKLNAVLSNSPGTEVQLVAPLIHAEIFALAEQFKNVYLHERPYEKADLEDIDLVFVAVDDPEISEQVVYDAHKFSLLVNVADTPALCDFYLSSIVKKGELKIGISTNGKSPVFAKRLKEILAAHIPADTEISIHNLNKLREHLDGDFSEKVKQLNAVTDLLVSKRDLQKQFRKRIRNCFLYFSAAIALMIAGHLLLSFLPLSTVTGAFVSLAESIDITILYWIAGGFIAAFIDGALGMAYGVSATTFLLSFGIPPAVASMSVHASEIFTSGVSGLMHLRFGNVNSKMFRNLVLPGVTGAIIGAYVLSSFEEYNTYIKPVVSAYTLFLGIVIIAKALRKDKIRKKIKRLFPLAFFGGLMDSIGGGGWGPIVSSTLIAWGKNPRYTIGSVNLAEFFVALASSFTFISLIGLSHWQIIAGLVTGGCIAAPIGALLAKRLRAKTMMIFVGIIVIVSSLRIFYKSFF